MGYYIKVEPNVKIFVEDLNPMGNKTILFKNSKLIPFKDSGHGTFYDQRDKFNEELVKFIEE